MTREINKKKHFECHRTVMANSLGRQAWVSQVGTEAWTNGVRYLGGHKNSLHKTMFWEWVGVEYSRLNQDSQKYEKRESGIVLSR